MDTNINIHITTSSFIDENQYNSSLNQSTLTVNLTNKTVVGDSSENLWCMQIISDADTNNDSTWDDKYLSQIGPFFYSESLPCGCYGISGTIPTTTNAPTEEEVLLYIVGELKKSGIFVLVNGSSNIYNKVRIN